LEQALAEVLKSIKHISLIPVGKGGLGKSTIYSTDSMDSLQQRKEGELKSLLSLIYTK